MANPDYREQIAHALKSDAQYRAKGATIVHFRCPRHNDGTASAWMRDGAWGCLACGFTERLASLGDHLGIERPKHSGGAYTVEDYASEKGFSVERLMKWGVRTVTGRYGTDEVAIPYYDTDGSTVLRSKIRLQKGKKFWGDGEGVYLYGIHQLAQSKPEKPVLIVEGESDCHAAWHSGVLAVGVPGATTWKSAWAPYFVGRDVFVWQEPDQGGPQLVAAVTRDLPNARVVVASNDGIKDVADLFHAAGRDFKSALLHRLEHALKPGHKPRTTTYDAAVGGTLDQLKARKLQPVSAIATPFATWNAACRGAGGHIGLARGWHITLAANTGLGKSLIGINMAAAAIWNGERVNYNSLEMSPDECMTRLLSIVSGEPAYKLDQGEWFDAVAFDRACQRLNEIYEEKGGAVFFNRYPLSRIDDMLTGMREQVEYDGCTMSITDYLQLADVPGMREMLDRITFVSGAIRKEAKALNIVSAALSQFNRETSKDRENPPMPQGMMGGSPLENDSDQVVLVDHTTYKRYEGTDYANAQLTLAKNRHGPLAKIQMQFNYRDLSVTEIPPVMVVDNTTSRYEKSEADDSEGGDTSFDQPALELIS